MKVKLTKKYPKRIIVVGCSFTHWEWTTWINIIAHEFPKAEYIDYSRAGSGNFGIASAINQLDAKLNFNKNDLVFVQWSSLARHDTLHYRNKKPEWNYSGHMSQEELRHIDLNEHILKQLVVMHATQEMLLGKTNCHFLKMLPIRQLDQYEHEYGWEGLVSEYNTLMSLFQPTLDKMISPSFYEALWNNDMKLRQAQLKEIHPWLTDYHPLPSEHLKYVETVFDFDLKQETKDKVHDIHKDVVRFINHWYSTHDEHSWKGPQHLAPHRDKWIIYFPQNNYVPGVII